MLPKKEDVEKMTRTALQKLALKLEKQFEVSINRGGKTEDLRAECLKYLDAGKPTLVDEPETTEVVNEEPKLAIPEPPKQVAPEVKKFDMDAVQARIRELSGGSMHPMYLTKALHQTLHEMGYSMEEYQEARRNRR